ncbi:transposase [Serratia fonticola]|uniref:Transposase n=1 Tax=Serratia fonticola TaxID=47917 RepID=A0AAJ1YF38_SERFO|nr:transposase [Serratia fonticola]MDQ9126814.1 transposase [Serratia fonticola]
MRTKEQRFHQQYSHEFKLKLVKMTLEASENGSSVAALAREYGINDNLLFKCITTQAAPNDSYICLLCGCTLQDCPYAKPDTSEIQLIHRLQHLIPNG